MMLHSRGQPNINCQPFFRRVRECRRGQKQEMEGGRVVKRGSGRCLTRRSSISSMDPGEGNAVCITAVIPGSKSEPVKVCMV